MFHLNIKHLTYTYISVTCVAPSVGCVSCQQTKGVMTKSASSIYGTHDYPNICNIVLHVQSLNNFSVLFNKH